MALPEPAEKQRQRLLRPFLFRLWLWKTLPLAAVAGLRLRRLDEDGCEVALPGGWRTQNPFRSTYFAAQAMAAEMSTGAPASLLVLGHPASVSMLVTGLRAVFTKKIVGESRFTFSEAGAMRSAVERAVATGEASTFVARSRGRTADGTVAAEFEVTWSFKRRAMA
ncbi:MAG TPA: DUF4442 domain-containing protein [Vicinamibacteria bacterium]